MGIFEKFRLGFKKSANNFASGLREIIIKKEIDDSTLNKIEEFLISSDVGIDAASDIRDIILACCNYYSKLSQLMSLLLI